MAILKISTPPILSDKVEAPATLLDWVFFSWPNVIGYAVLALLTLGAAGSLRRNSAQPTWFLILPALWLGWQILATAGSVDMTLTRATITHFASVTLLFYLGYFALSSNTTLKGLRGPLLAGYCMVLWSGLEQHFGGLQATREMIYAQPNWQEYPPDFLEKISKDRIFATLFYPNAFAGGILLLTPLCSLSLWHLSSRLQLPSRVVITGVFVCAALACLVWTESRSGWLVAMALGLVGLAQVPIPKKQKIAILTAAFVLGLGAFFWKYSSYFQKGATSVAARFEYWKAAWNTAQSNPVFGTGPGTFMRAYAKIKPPEAEMARLAHNDYLQQASDSGFLGALLYAGLMGLALFRSYQILGRDPFRWAVWLGLLAFALQSFVEFGLHVPALAWPFFLLMGWLCGQSDLRPKSAASLKPESV